MGTVDAMSGLLDPEECRRRDAVLRAYILSRTWDGGGEFHLVRDLVSEGHPTLDDYPFLVDYEWEVWPGASEGGKGDLVFSDARGRFAVVEVKFLDMRADRTVGTRRTGHRKKVREQAQNYARALQRKLGAACASIRAFAHTNEVAMLEVPWTM